MTREYRLLRGRAPAGGLHCPHCKSSDPQNMTMRGVVQSPWRKFFGLAYCAVVCRMCREIIGWEKP